MFSTYKNLLSLAVPLGFGVLISTAVMAQQPPPSGTGPTDPNPKISAGKPTPTAKGVGSCNSPKGCRALEKACLQVKGHTYKPVSGGGVCDDGKSSVARKDIERLAAERGGVEDAKCFTVALCGKLRNTCQGNYQQISPNHGVCKD